MTWVRWTVIAVVVCSLSIAMFHSTRKSAKAAEPTPVDSFGEEESAQRFYGSQTRHWRHLLVKR